MQQSPLKTSEKGKKKKAQWQICRQKNSDKLKMFLLVYKRAIQYWRKNGERCLKQNWVKRSTREGQRQPRGSTWSRWEGSTEPSDTAGHPAGVLEGNFWINCWIKCNWALSEDMHSFRGGKHPQVWSHLCMMWESLRQWCVPRQVISFV